MHAKKTQYKKNKTQEKIIHMYLLLFPPLFSFAVDFTICSTKQYMACYLQGLMLQYTHNKISCIRNHGSVLWLIKDWTRSNEAEGEKHNYGLVRESQSPFTFTPK
jgi:hypothetical protein